MKKGTHNSMTYLEPLRWWMRLFVPFSKCQRISLAGQAAHGARYFDIRVRYNKDRGLVFAHGLVEYKGDPFTELRKLRDMRIQGCVIRIGYEGLLEEDSEAGDHFLTFVGWARDRFNVHQVFSKKDSRIIYMDDTIHCLDLYEMFADWRRIPYPLRYAKRNNTEYHRRVFEATNAHYAMLDFIDIR